MKKLTMNPSTLLGASFGFAKTRLKWTVRIPMYLILACFAILYLEPVLYMISMAFKSGTDLTDVTAKWIPRNPTMNNFQYAMTAMKVIPTFPPGQSWWTSLMNSNLMVSIITTFIPALIQVYTCAVAGYAFARLHFPLKRTLFACLLISYIIPPQTVFMPLIWIFRAIGVINSPLSFIIPAFFGVGLKGSLFVIIYMQFFKKFPMQLEEAAYIDGAGTFKVFWRVMLPLAKPARITVFLFSMVWHWNETYLTSLFYTRINTLATALKTITTPNGDYSVSLMMVQMACALLLVAPLLVIYLFTQRYFTESIERTGIVE